MTYEFTKELIANALDGLTQALDSFNDIDNVDYEIEIIQGKIENAYDELMKVYES
jgi:hypothetical protein